MVKTNTDIVSPRLVNLFVLAQIIRPAGDHVPLPLRRLLAWLVGVEKMGSYYLVLAGNPWAEPPEAVVKRGMAAVTGYFEDLFSSPYRVRRNTVKIVLVGQEGAGKTR